ncbi:MAG TPA: T9SS type A sorting domain-containing protein [Flavobacterium sp.]
MKKILFLSIFLLGLYNATGQNYYMTAPEGYGAATTGGAGTGSTTVTVSNYTDFYNAVNSNKTTLEVPKIVLVSGIIDFPTNHTSITIKNKSIVGLPGAKLRNLTNVKDGSGILYIKSGSNNVIIRNLIFEGPGANDVEGEDLLTNEGTNVWIDHCAFQDGLDGNFDNKGKADNVTISWCKFSYLKGKGAKEHRFTNLVGSDFDDVPATGGKYSITFKNCYWAEGCVERMPRARNAELHILNCYYSSSVAKLAIGLGGGISNTTCYVENSNFVKIGTSSTVANADIYEPYPEDGGTIAVKFDGCIKGTTPITVTGLDAGTVSIPSYTYTVMPVADVATYVPNVSCGAGATLQVTTAGVISTNCPNLGVEDFALNGVKLYPTFVNDILNIDLPDTVSGDATIDIYSIAGAKVFSSSKSNVTPGDKLSVNVASLSKGVYLCTLQIGGTATTLKFIKE